MLHFFTLCFPVCTFTVREDLRPGRLWCWTQPPQSPMTSGITSSHSSMWNSTGGWEILHQIFYLITNMNSNAWQGALAAVSEMANRGHCCTIPNAEQRAP